MTGKARVSTRDATAKRRPLARSRDADPESPDVLRGYYSQMVLIRSFELRTAEMYARRGSADTATSTWARKPQWWV